MKESHVRTVGAGPSALGAERLGAAAKPARRAERAARRVPTPGSERPFSLHDACIWGLYAREQAPGLLRENFPRLDLSLLLRDA